MENKKITQAEFDKIVFDHKLWLDDKSQGKCAELSAKDLRELNLRGVNLSSANLWGANLSGLDLRDCDFSWATLKWANFTETDLRGANTEGVEAKGVWLNDANLTGRYNEDIAKDFFEAEWWESNYDDIKKPLTPEEMQKKKEEEEDRLSFRPRRKNG